MGAHCKNKGGRPRVFGNEEVPATGRYRIEMVTGQLREKPHQRTVQQSLDEGGSRGWELVSATTTYTGGGYATALYWDASPRR
jgi:hypothetical protein